ncbi:MAG: hypothetical protein ACRCTQ_02980 [Brevinemataceae bacterium]
MERLKVEISADRKYSFINMSNKIKYSVIITNLGVEKVTNVKIKNFFSLGANYIPGTFSINGNIQNIEVIENFINIGSINSNANILISYYVEIVECNPPSQICSNAIVLYSDGYGVDNLVCSPDLYVSAIKLDIKMQLDSDKKISKIGDVVTFSALIRNNSNIAIGNIKFFNDSVEYLELIPSSILINNTEKYMGNLNEGICAGYLNTYSSLIISFQQIIKKIPRNNVISSRGNITFNYGVLDNYVLSISKGESFSNIINIKIESK